MPDERIQREIEEILNRLDEFVPEQRATSRVRRSSDAATAFGRAIMASLAGISLRQVMLTALALIVLGVLTMRAYPVGAWVLVAGVILFLTSFALSFFSRGSPPKVEKRWRGQPMELDEPSLGDRLRAWLQAKRRPRR